jgi:hypothetical protein
MSSSKKAVVYACDEEAKKYLNEFFTNSRTNIQIGKKIRENFIRNDFMDETDDHPAVTSNTNLIRLMDMQLASFLPKSLGLDYGKGLISEYDLYFNCIKFADYEVCLCKNGKEYDAQTIQTLENSRFNLQQSIYNMRKNIIKSWDLDNTPEQVKQRKAFHEDMQRFSSKKTPEERMQETEKALRSSNKSTSSASTQKGKF